MRNPFRHLFAVRLWRHVTKRNRRPYLNSEVIQPYEYEDISEDIEILMQMRYAKDVNSAIQLMREHSATTAMDVIEAMPRRRRSLWRRLMNWIRRLEGSFEYDPNLSYIRNGKPPQHRVGIQYLWDWELDEDQQ